MGSTATRLLSKIGRPWPPKFCHPGGIALFCHRRQTPVRITAAMLHATALSRAAPRAAAAFARRAASSKPASIAFAPKAAGSGVPPPPPNPPGPLHEVRWGTVAWRVALLAGVGGVGYFVVWPWVAPEKKIVAAPSRIEDLSGVAIARTAAEGNVAAIPSPAPQPSAPVIAPPQLAVVAAVAAPPSSAAAPTLSWWEWMTAPRRSVGPPVVGGERGGSTSGGSVAGSHSNESAPAAAFSVVSVPAGVVARSEAAAIIVEAEGGGKAAVTSPGGGGGSAYSRTWVQWLTGGSGDRK